MKSRIVVGDKSVYTGDDIVINKALIQEMEVILNDLGFDYGLNQPWKAIIYDWKEGDQPEKPHYRLDLSSPGYKKAEVSSPEAFLNRLLDKHDKCHSDQLAGLKINYSGHEWTIPAKYSCWDYDEADGFTIIIFEGVETSRARDVCTRLFGCYQQVCDTLPGCSYDYDLEEAFDYQFDYHFKIWGLK